METFYTGLWEFLIRLERSSRCAAYYSLADAVATFY